MKYIKITNQTKNVNRLKLEKLGLSTKRDDVKTIGQFGSGIKFAPIAAVRKGMQFIFVGNDDKGQYTLEYIVKDDEGVPSIYYKYGEYEKPSSFTPEAGVLSWDSDYQIYREVIANAVDESISNGNSWDVDVVDVEEIIPVDGEFSVYITATDGMLEIHNNFDKYFTFNREPIYVAEHGQFKLYEPIDDVMRVYSKGVLVFSTDSTLKSYSDDLVSGFFDYEFDDRLQLNEDRTVSNTSNLNHLIITSLGQISDEKIVGQLFNLFEDQRVETLNTYYEYRNIVNYVWQSNSYYDCGKIYEYWTTHYPKTVAVDRKAMSTNFEETIKAKGYKPFCVDHEGLLLFLYSMKVPSYSDIFGEYFKYKTTYDLSNYPVLLTAIDIVTDVMYEMHDLKYIVGIYFNEDEESNILAMTTDMALEDEEETKTKILFNHQYAEDGNVKKLISTLVHEWDHYSTGIGDGNNEGRLFRELADEKIGHLIYELWKAKGR